MIGKEIVAKTSCAYISIDQIFEELGFNWTTNKLPNEKEWQQIMKIVYQKIQTALRNNENVLYDSTNHTKASRDELRGIAQSVKAETKIIYIKKPSSTFMLKQPAVGKFKSFFFKKTPTSLKIWKYFIR